MGSATAMEMQRIIECWAFAEKRAKHLCAFETLGLNCRCRKPSQEEVKAAWKLLSRQLHPDRNTACESLATEAMRCVNLAKQHLFDVHFGRAEARVTYKHEPDKEAAQAREAAEEAAAAEAAEAAEASAVAAQQARLVAEPHVAAPHSQEAERTGSKRPHEASDRDSEGDASGNASSGNASSGTVSSGNASSGNVSSGNASSGNAGGESVSEGGDKKPRLEGDSVSDSWAG